MKKIITFIRGHKIVSFVIIAVIISSVYFGYQKINTKESANIYTTATVEKGMLISSIFSTGQIAASNQVGVKPKVSGDVVYVGVKNGQEVKAGTLLIQIDSHKAQTAVNDAKTALETAKLELDKLLEPVSELDLLKAENDLAKAKESKQEAEDNITEGYEDAFVAVTDAFFDLPTIITMLRDILYSQEIADTEISVSQGDNITALKNSLKGSDDRIKLEQFISDAKNAYEIARTKYNENLDNYKNTSRYSEYNIIEALLEETLETLRAMDEAMRNEINLLDFWVDCRSQKDLRIFSKVTAYQSNLKSYTSKVNSHLSNLLNIQRSLQDNREAVLNAQRSIEELELSLAELKAGADELDIRAKKIAIQQKEDALLDTQQTLADHFIRAPFDGQIAEVNASKGDNVSSNDSLCTLIAEQKIAEVTLNEIDVAQVQTGQKANLAFDAVEDLSITSKVVEVDTLGTNDQGVVSYGIKIAFDVQDERIKPGMSVTANIIIKSKQNVISVPNSAVKSQQGVYYVQVMENSNPRFQQVEIGISNDTMTEIVSGLKEGDVVVTGTISQTSGTQTTQDQGFQLPGTTGGMGGKGMK